MSVTEVGILLIFAVAIGWPVCYLLGVAIERERQVIREEETDGPR